jgi:hypothetical protein
LVSDAKALNHYEVLDGFDLIWFKLNTNLKHRREAMPIITIGVPASTAEGELVQLRAMVKMVLWQDLKIPEPDTTVEFTPCLALERSVIRFETRSSDLTVNKAAETVGKLIERIMGLRVECLVVKLAKENTGLYLSN